MKHCYSIQPDDTYLTKFRQRIEVNRACNLPGVQCGHCGEIWATTGVAYPTVECKTVKHLLPSADVIGLAEFNELRAVLQPIVDGRILSPGCKFGCLSGTLKGKKSQVAWVNPWTFLIRNSVLDNLEQTIGGASAIINGSKDYFEPEAPPIAILSADPEVSCAKCKRISGPTPKTFTVEKESIVSACSFFRSMSFPTLMFATEEMGESMLDASYPGVKISKINLH